MGLSSLCSSAHGLVPRGPRFESSHPDYIRTHKSNRFMGSFNFQHIEPTKEIGYNKNTFSVIILLNTFTFAWETFIILNLQIKCNMML